MSSSPVFSGGGRARPLTVRRSAQARRYRLSVDPRDGAVRLTLPRRAALAAGLRWAEEQRGWIESALAAVPASHPIRDGAILPVEGRPLTVAWRPDEGRRVRLEGEALIVGGPEEMVAARTLRWLRALARERLEAETRAVATQAGVSVGRVHIGDPRSRWGSCSSGGIRISRQLKAMLPPEVRFATVVHEVAHRLHMNHSPAFHAAVARLLGREPKAERAWLRANGTALHRIGAED